MRGDIADALGRMKPRRYDYATDKAVRYLQGHLGDEEKVLEMLNGSMSRHAGLLALTTQRLIFLEPKLVGEGESYFADLSREDISSVQTKKSWLSGASLIVFPTRGATWTLEDGVQEDVERLAHAAKGEVT